MRHTLANEKFLEKYEFEISWLDGSIELKVIIESEEERKKADETMNRFVRDHEVLAHL